MTGAYMQGFLTKCAERGVDGRAMLKMAAPNANETYMDRNPGIGPVTQRQPSSFTGSDGVTYRYADTFPNDVRRLETDYIPAIGDSIVRYELPNDVAEKTRVRAMDALSGHIRIRKRHTPGHDDAVSIRNVTDPGLPDDMKRRAIAYNWLHSIRDDYSGGKNFAMSSFWPDGTNAPMHALIGDGKIPRTVLQHETGHAINAGGYESDEDYRKKDELEEEIDAHVNGGSIDSELARGALSTYAVPYYLRDNPDRLKQYTDELLSKVDPEQLELAKEIMADEGYEGTNTAEQAAALNRYKRLVFPDRSPESVTFDDIQDLATNGHMRTALDSPNVLSMQDAARYVQDSTGRPVIPIDLSRLDDSLFDLDELSRKSFDAYRGTPFFGGTLGSEANAAAAESPYLAGILDYIAKDPSHSGEGYTYDRYPNSDRYLYDLADYMVHKARQRRAR